MDLYVRRYTWDTAFLYLIVNGDVDSACSKEQKVIIPADLVAVLKNASFQGHPILKDDGVVLLQNTAPIKACPFTALHFSLIVLLLTILCAVFRKNWMDIPLLVLQTSLGLVSVYLVVFSTLPCTQWSWLLIPFNPLPLIFWHWRRKWALPFGLVCIVWAVVMLLLKHPVTCPCYIVLAVAQAVALFYLHIAR